MKYVPFDNLLRLMARVKELLLFCSFSSNTVLPATSVIRMLTVPVFFVCMVIFRVDTTGLGYNNGLPVFASLLFISNTAFDAAAVVKFVPLTLPLPMGGAWRQPVCTRHS